MASSTLESSCTDYRTEHRRGNDFSVRGAKIERLFGWWGKQKIDENNQDSQIQSITLCIMYFSKKLGLSSVQWAWGKSPEAREFSRIFVLKVTLQSIGLLFTLSYRKMGVAGCSSCSPNNFVGGATAPLFHWFLCLWKQTEN